MNPYNGQDQSSSPESGSKLFNGPHPQSKWEKEFEPLEIHEAVNNAPGDKNINGSKGVFFSQEGYQVIEPHWNSQDQTKGFNRPDQGYDNPAFEREDGENFTPNNRDHIPITKVGPGSTLIQINPKTLPPNGYIVGNYLQPIIYTGHRRKGNKMRGKGHRSKAGTPLPVIPPYDPPSLSESASPHHVKQKMPLSSVSMSSSIRSTLSPSPNDNDLADYSESSSSSTESLSTSPYESDDGIDESLAPLQNATHSSNEVIPFRKMDNSEDDDLLTEDDCGRLAQRLGDRSSTVLGIDGSSQGGERTDPCSSSSLQGRKKYINNKVYPAIPPTDEGSRSQSVSAAGRESVIFRDDSMKKQQQMASASSNLNSVGTEENGVPVNLKESYKQSGVGRHFGRKQTLSSMNLVDDAQSYIETPAVYFGIDFYEWKSRLKAALLLIMASLLILSTASLLFVFPIVVDPILLGFEAQFSVKPVTCRTTNFRNGTGAQECTLPTCREGCTADIFSCYFIDVEYKLLVPSLSQSNSSYEPIPTGYGSSTDDINATFIQGNQSSDLQSLNSSLDIPQPPDGWRNGTLFININGCGYPPVVNCSEYKKTFGSVGTKFDCYYSGINESIVVTNYSARDQKRHLFLALTIPFSIVIISASSLLFLFHCRIVPRNKFIDKNVLSIKLIDEAEGNEGIQQSTTTAVLHDHKKSNGVSHLNNKASNNHPTLTNGNIPKVRANGHAFEQTMAGLMGYSSPEKIQNSIKKLPHQHDSFEMPYMNGFIPGDTTQNNDHDQHNQTNNKRAPRYAKNKKLTRTLSVDDSR